MTQSPDDLVYAKLITMFTSTQVGVGPVVYNAAGDPTPPYVCYTRVSSEYERDLAGNPMVEMINYDISIASMFFNACEVDFSALDNWTSSGWYFNLSGQEISSDQFSITFNMTAAKAIG